MRRLRAVVAGAEFAKGYDADRHVEAVLRMLEEAGAGVES